MPLGSWLHPLIPGISETWGLTIHVYALAILTGIVVALIIANQRLTRRGGEPGIIIDVSLWAIAFGIVGARLWHVATHLDDYIGPGKDPITILYVWEGGLAIFGTLLAGALGVWIACRIHGLRFLSVADAVAPGLLVAQALGRFGNYFNQELFGLPTDLPWGLQIDRPNSAIPSGIGDDVLFHPTFLYEMLWNLAGAVLIVFIIENSVKLYRRDGLIPVGIELTRRPYWQWGRVFALYLIWYGIGRSWFESIRLDPSETFLGIRSNVWGALAAMALGLIILIVQHRRHPGVEPSPYRAGREWTDPAEVDSEDTYPDITPGTDGAGDDAKPVSATSGASRSS
ncbi:MAG: prolipoprotein diacylglyceryl transferase [Microbacteriaceae bacterium]|nr:prolipoprotein diacylglyceryl transferase [Microbacteriaceae bacterium]